MARTRVVFYRDDDGSVPVLNWIDTLSPKAKVKCRSRIELLREFGHELRRPEADYLRDGVYELRISLQRQQYRILYFFHGRTASILAHGLIKERIVPPRAIHTAIERRRRFEQDPSAHIYEE